MALKQHSYQHHGAEAKSLRMEEITLNNRTTASVGGTVKVTLQIAVFVIMLAVETQAASCHTHL